MKRFHFNYTITLIIPFLWIGLMSYFNIVQSQDLSKPGTDTLILGAYTVPKEAYEKEIIPAFQKYWKEKTGRDVRFEQSYVGSGAQARSIISGFEADVAALSLEADIQQIEKAGLIVHNWKDSEWKGMITQSLVVIGYRPGNPKNIQDWEDLTRDGIDILCPNPKTSGGAQWYINAVYGAGLMMTEKDKTAKDPDYAESLLSRFANRIKVMDKSGRESVSTFERGIGDAILTYENEALLRTLQGREFPFIIPKATILIENPVAVVDKYVDKHGTRALAEEFVKFLYTEESQRSFARYGFRPVLPTIFQEFKDKYPIPEYLFDITYLGGWDTVGTQIYGPDGIWTRVARKMNQKDK